LWPGGVVVALDQTRQLVARRGGEPGWIRKRPARWRSRSRHRG
jgi:hypothetical protein